MPVIVETGVFTSELMVTNFSEEPKTVTFRFRAEAVQTPDKTATIEWTFHPGQQVIVPNIVDMVRKLGAAGVGPAGQTFAGALFATVAEGDMSGIAIGARTATPGGGGQYGVYYNAVPYGGAFLEGAWVEALQQNEENRSNLALVNTGEVDDSPSVFQLDIYDGATGMLANTVTGLRVAAKGWRQINGILGSYAPGNHSGLCADQQDFRQQSLPGLRNHQRRRGSRTAQRRRRLSAGPGIEPPQKLATLTRGSGAQASGGFRPPETRSRPQHLGVGGPGPAWRRPRFSSSH